MSELRRFCAKHYAERMQMRQDLPADFKRALKTHERLPAMIDNLVDELNSPAMRKRKLSQMVIIDLVYDITDLFIAGALKHAQEREMSVLERQRRIKEQENLQLARDFIDSLNGEEEVSRDAKGNETVRETTEIDGTEIQKRLS